MKVGQQFEINELYVFVHNFEVLGYVTLVLKPKNRPASLA